MSFGGGTGRTRSGTKGFSSKEKKQKRKKQDYHIHKRAHFQETERPDPEEVRKRTILALERLGHQVPVVGAGRVRPRGLDEEPQFAARGL